MQGSITHKHEFYLSPILEVELFNMQGIDFMGPFVSSFGNKYILVAIVCVSKQVEAIALPTKDGRSVINFMKQYIFTCFGTTGAIKSDGGSHLDVIFTIEKEWS